MVIRIWSPIAGKNKKGQWVQIDGKAGVFAQKLETEDHLKYVEGDDTVKKMMIKRKMDRPNDKHSYTDEYLKKKEGEKKEKKGKHKKSNLVVVSSSSDSTSNSGDHKKKKGDEDKITKEDIVIVSLIEDEDNEAGPRMDPKPSPDSTDGLVEGITNIGIEDPNYISPREYSAKLLPSDMGAKGGDKK